jgi:hypothetical protein
MWCWAATIQTIIDFHDPYSNISQCDIVEDYFEIDNCEDATMAGGYMSRMKDFLEDNNLNVNFNCDYAAGPLSIDEIRDNILDCKPIIIEISTSPFQNSTHAVVIMGIWKKFDAMGNSFIEVIIRDPFPYSWSSIVRDGFNGIEYSRLRSIWRSTLYNIELNESE